MNSVLLSLVLNEFRGLRRNRMTFFWTFLFPFFFFTIFVLGNGGANNLGGATVDVVDNDKTELSQEYRVFLGKALVSNETITMTIRGVDSELEIPPGHIRVTVPKGFAETISARRRPSVAVEYDYSGSPAVRAAGYLVSLVTPQFSKGGELAFGRPAAATGNIGRHATPLTYGQYLLAGVMIMTLLSGGVIATATVLVVLREFGAFKIYGCLPISKWQFIVSILVTRVLVMLFGAVILLFGAKYVYGISINILSLNVLNVLLLVLCAGIMFCLLGIAIGSRTADVGFTTLVCNIIYFPLIMFNDLTFRLNTLPDTLQTVLSYIPVRELGVTIRAVLFYGVPFSDQIHLLLSILIWSTIFLLVGLWRFRWHA